MTLAQTTGSLDNVTFPSAEVQKCPYPFYKTLRAEAPIYNCPAGSNRWLVSRWADIVYVLQHPELFKNDMRPERAWHGFYSHNVPKFPDRGLSKYEPTPSFLSDGSDHRSKRKWSLAVVSRPWMTWYAATLRGIADELIDAFIDRGECEFRSDYAEPLPGYLILDALRLPRTDLPTLTAWVKDLMRGFFGLTEEEARARDAGNDRFNAYVHQEVLSRYESPQDDLMSELIQMQVAKDGEIDINYQVVQIANLIGAASEATPHVLVAALNRLLEHPELQVRARSDSKVIRRIVEETMRLESPVQWLPRYCPSGATIGETSIPAGSVLLLLYASGSRDPERWSNPDAFDVDRRYVARDQLGFGRGIHHCAGAPVARLEGEIAFERLLARLTNLSAAPASDARPSHLAMMHPQRTLHLTFDRA